MRSLSTRVAAVALGAVVALGLVAGPAAAHERRTVGAVQLIVGWASEPTYTGSLNAVQLRVMDPSATPPAPVTDIGDGLKVEVTFGDQKVGPLPLESVFNSPGEYQAPVIPTRPGVYAFRFVGTIRGQAIDETFTSSDSTFESPEESGAIEFPTQDPTRAELGDRVERLDPRLSAATKAADDGKSAANRATAIGVVGLALGAAALALAVAGRRRSKA
ncbi:MAG: hypothetical protein QOE93_774 [Actinomycetota bacterium]|jgi:hypothetical protein|nr:hypothetical protein [Actinomycetota bacterium]